MVKKVKNDQKLKSSGTQNTCTHAKRTHTQINKKTKQWDALQRRKVGWLGLNWNTGCDIVACLSPWRIIILLPGTCTVWMDAACRESGLVLAQMWCMFVVVAGSLRVLLPCVRAGAFVRAYLMLTLIWTVGSHFFSYYYFSSFFL